MGKIFKIALTVVGVAVAFIPGVGTAIGGAILGATGTSFGAIAAVYGGLSAVASLGVMSALGMASKALGLGPSGPKVSPATTDRLRASINPAAPRLTVVGHTALGTDVAFQEYTGSDQEYLNTILIAASHKIQAIDEIWFDQELAWSASGGVQGRFAGYLSVTTRTEGSPANAFTITGSTNWTSSGARLTGCAYLWLRYKMTGNSKKAESPFAQTVTSRITVRGRGAHVYDPRHDSTVTGGSGSQRADDQSTWQYADDDTGGNPALQLLFYLLGWRIQNPSTGQWKLAVGLGIPPSRIDLASFIAAANICDETVTLAAGGTEPRYRSAGVWSEADLPTTVMDNLCAAMNGVRRDAGGQISLDLLVNDLGTYAADFTEADVIGQFNWIQTPPLHETFNVVRGQYTDGSNASLYQLADYPDVTLDSPDGIDRPAPFNLALVQSASQAQRLAKQYLERAQYPGTFAAEFLSTAWRCQVGKVVRLTFPALGFNQKLFRVIEHTIRLDGICPMVLREENANIYRWEADEAPAVIGASPTTYDPLNLPIVLAIDDVRATVPLGQNLVINSDLIAGTIGFSAGWNGNAGGTISRARNGSTSYSGQLNVLSATRAGTPGNGTVFDCYITGGSAFADMQRYGVPVLPGDRIYYSWLLARYRCAATYAIVGWYDGGGAYIAEDSVAGGRLNGAQFGDPANFERVGQFATAPSGARYALIWARLQADGAQADPYVFAAQPFLAKVSADQTEVPPYTSGPPDRQADRTYENTASGIISQGLLATLNNLVLGGPYLGGFGTLAGQSSIWFGSGQLTETSGGVVANLVNFKTSLGTAAAIVNQGILAVLNSVDWSTLVIGSGKPANYATRNEAGDNMLTDPLKMSSWSTTNGSVHYENGGGNAGAGIPRDNYRIVLDSNAAQAAIQSEKIPVTPGEKLFTEFVVWRQAAVGSAEIVMGLWCFDGEDRYIGAVQGGYVLNPAADSWVTVKGEVIVPSCSKVQPYFQRYNSGAGGSVYFAEPYIGRKEKGADITGNNTALAIAFQGLLATKNLIDATSFLADAVVETAKVAAGAISGGGGGVETASTFNGNGSYQVVASYSFSLDDSALMLFIANASQNYTSGTPDWAFRIVLDGVIISQRDGPNKNDTPMLGTIRSGVAAGSHTVELHWLGRNSGIQLLIGSLVAGIPLMR